MKTLKFGLGMAILALAGAAWGDYYWTGASTTNPTDWYDTANWYNNTMSGGNCVFGGGQKASLTSNRTVVFTNAVTAAVNKGLWVENGSTNRDEAIVWTTGDTADDDAGLTVNGTLTVGTGTWGALKAVKGKYVFTGTGDIGTSSGCSYMKVEGAHFSFGNQFDLAIGSAKTVFEMTGGTVDVAGDGWWACDGSARTVADISGGTITITNSLYLGNNNGSGSSDITIRDAGRLDILSTGNGLSYYEGSNVVNVVDGGTLGVYGFRYWKSPSPAELNLEGGRLVVLGGGRSPFIDPNDNFKVTVRGDKESILDLNGANVKLSTVKIGGTGTLVITNSSATAGSITFATKPTCKVAIANGTVYMPDGLTPETITLGAGGFLEYDLSSVKESDLTTNLAENVTISVAEDDEVARHIIIKNSGSVSWNVTYSGTTLSAKSTSDDVAQGAFTIFTGYYDGNYPNDQVKSFVNGKATDATTEIDVIVPASTTTLGLYVNMSCANFVMNGDLTIDGKIKNMYQHFHPRHVSGTGTLTFTTETDKYGYLESSNHPSGSGVDIDVPVVLAGHAWVTSLSAGTLNFKKHVTITGENVQAVPDRWTNTSPVFADDLTITGKYTCEYGTALAAGKTLSGSGSLVGNLNLSAGAIVGATITNANGTAEYVTVTGTANLKNATISVAGGDLVASAAAGTAITLFKATTISGWTNQTVTFGGKTWAVKAVTSDGDDDTLVATPVVGFTITLR